MKRQFINTTGTQGALRGRGTYIVGTHVRSDGRIYPFTKVRGFWRTARRRAIDLFPDATRFYVQRK